MHKRRPRIRPVLDVEELGALLDISDRDVRCLLVNNCGPTDFPHELYTYTPRSGAGRTPLCKSRVSC